MDLPELTKFAKRYANAWCSQDPESVAAFFAERGSISINNGAAAVGRTAIAKEAQAFMTTFPDMVVTFDKLEPRADRTAFHWTLIGQNTNAVRSATAQTVHEHFANWYHLIAADAELARIAANGLRDYASLSEQEKVRFIAAFMAFLSYGQNAFLKWRQGLLEPALWTGWEQVLMNLIGAPGGKGLWKEPIFSARNSVAMSKTI